MSLMNIMYHHVGSDLCSNQYDIFEQHIKYISKNYNTILPGESITKRSICLTFDDAYSDFYFRTYPLIKKYNLKALLAVPSKFIIPNTSNKPEYRMSFKHNDAMINFRKGTLCTEEEIKDMLKSGLIAIASHSHSHKNLTNPGVNLRLEIKESKKILENMFLTEINSYVFPYGKYNKDILQYTLKYYKHAFRIGNAIHRDFNGINGVNYRINGDNLRKPDEIFKTLATLKYRIKGIIKKVSGK